MAPVLFTAALNQVPLLWATPAILLISGVLAAAAIGPTLGAERVARRDGDVDHVDTTGNPPFTVLRRELRNPGSADREVRAIEFTQEIVLKGKTAEYRTLGVDGLKSAESATSSYLFLGVARPDATDGTVAGWVTQERGSGSVHSHTVGDSLSITGRLEFGRLRIKPGQSVISDAFVIGRFPDARDGLEAYASAIAAANEIKLPKIPNGYCTWYSRPHGGASDEKALAQLGEFCRRELRKYGFDTILIDDQWQGPGIPKGGIIGNGPTGNFTRHNPTGPYPSGMKATADQLKANGIRPGLWFTPFAWDPRDPLFKEHQDWFVTKEDGSLYEVRWAGWCLDMTHPDARAFLGEAIQRITREWGYSYLKPDAMWCGLAAKCTYPGTTYVNDHFGDAVFHDRYKTGIEAYRAGIRTMRQSVGRDTYIAACNVAQNFRSMGGAIGLVDAMRIGPDTGAKWSSILPNFNLGTRLYFLHNRVWHNDPDCLIVRAPLTLGQARTFASWLAVSGSLNLVSEWLPELPAERLECIKRSMPNTGLAARPLDLFDHMPARIWHLTDNKRHVVGLFNWDETNAAQVSVELAQLGLTNAATEILGLDYWSGKLVPIKNRTVSAQLPPCGCSVLALTAAKAYPHLIGTSRHVTQCFVDVDDERWDRGTLSGTCKLVGDDPTELRILCKSTAGTWKPLRSEVTCVSRPDFSTADMKVDGDLLRLTLAVPGNTEQQVKWAVKFEETPLAAPSGVRLER